MQNREIGDKILNYDVFPPLKDKTTVTEARSRIGTARSVTATPLQQGMIFHGLARPGSGIDVEQIIVRIATRVDRGRLQRAFASLLDNHEVLRASFGWEQHDTPQIYFDESPALNIEEDDNASGVNFDEFLAEVLIEERLRGFALDAPPLMRVRLLHDSSGSVVIWTFHHVLLDGRSFAPLIEELILRYDESAVLAKKRPEFADYATWLAGQDHTSSTAFWRQHLSGLEAACVFPALNGRAADSQFGHVSARLDESDNEAVNLVCEQIGVSTNVLLQAVWALAVSHFADTNQVVFGATYTTRHCDFPDAGDVIGLLINTLPVRVDITPSLTGRELLQALSNHARNVRPHILTPLNVAKSAAGFEGNDQLFDTAVVFDRRDVDEALHALRPDWTDIHCEYIGQTNFALALIAYGGERLQLRLEHDRARIDDAHATVVFDTFLTLLRGICRQVDRAVLSLPILEAQARKDALGTRQLEAGATRCLHDMFRKVAAEYPERIAVRCDDNGMSYRQLDQRSDAIAAELLRRGVSVETRIGLCMERSNDMIASILGILKAGCAYVPMDPAYPDARIKFTLDDAGVETIVTDVATMRRLQTFGRSLVNANENSLSNADADVLLSKVCVDEHNLAYVIYTSGSTGTPKGVAVTHRNVARLFQSTQPWFGFGPDDKWTLFHSIAFDWTVFEIWGALAYGGELTVVPYWVSRSPEDFYRLLAERGTTVLCQTPSAFMNLQQAVHENCDSAPHRLRYVIFGGEALDLPALKDWVKRYGDERPKLINMYGITETTVHVTYREIAEADILGSSGSVIGEPIPDLEILLLNKYGEPVPVGMAGEICVAGEGLARGYLNQPELTEERFCTRVNDALNGIRLYRSGDLGRWLPNGDIVYCGRLDDQVKIRGFRIELGEIEAAITAVEGVQQAVVLASRGRAGVDRLVAYFVSRLIAAADVSEKLAERLPAHMVPAHVIRLDELPLTHNGKIDRSKLPAPEESQSVTDFRVPETDNERALVAICESILGTSPISADDDFFARGGDSILTIQLISRARKAGIALTARDVYQHSRLSDLARHGDRKPVSQRGRVDAAEGEAIPLLPIQQWFFDTVGPVNHWNQALSFNLRRPIETGILRDAMLEILRRHPILRAEFRHSDGRWTQHVTATANIEILEREVGESQIDDAHRRCLQEINNRIDLASNRNLCAGLLTLPDGTQELSIACHHLVVDGLTWRVIIHELDELLASGGTSAQQQAIEPEHIFSSWSHWLSSNCSSFGNETMYWRQRVAGRSAATYRHDQALHTSKQTPAQDAGIRSTVPRQAVVLAAFAAAMAESENRSTIDIDLESHGRSRDLGELDFSQAAGWFTTIFPFRVSTGDLAATLEASYREIIGIPENGVGFGALRSRDESLAEGSAQHLFNFMGNFSSLFSDCRELELLPLEFDSWRSRESGHSHPCEWIVAVDEDRLVIDALFDSSAISNERVREIADSTFEKFIELSRLIEERRIVPDQLVVGCDAWEFARESAPHSTRYLPTTPIQDLYLYGSRSGSDIGVEQWFLKFEGALDAERLRCAWEETLNAHSGLRTTFPVASTGEVVQVFNERASFVWSEGAVSGDSELEAACRVDAEKGLSIESGPMHRLLLLDAGSDTHYLVWTHHHLQIDGWSWPIVLSQVHERYRSKSDERRDESSIRSSDYAKYCDWILRSRPKIDVEFWSDYLDKLGNEGRLPNERTGSVGIVTHTSHIDAALAGALTRKAQRLQVTPSSLFHGAWARALGALLDSPRVCVGSTLSGRPAGQHDFSEIVGPFVTNLPLRVSLRSERPDETVSGVNALMLELQERQYFSQSEVQEVSGIPWVTPMFESLVVYQNYRRDGSTYDLGDDIHVVDLHAPVRTNYPLTLVITPEGSIRLDFIYDSARLSADFIAAAAQATIGMLNSIADDSPTPVTRPYDFADKSDYESQYEPRSMPPESPMERRLLEIWREIFGQNSIGVTDNFFDLGGRSIMVPALMSRVRNVTGRNVSVAALFQNPTVKGLAAYLTIEPGSGQKLADKSLARADQARSALRRAGRHRGRAGRRDE